MPGQFWEALLNAPALGAGATYTTSAALLDVSPTPQYSIVANSLIVGSVLRVTASGVFSTTGTPTLLLGVYYGGIAGTKLAATGATTTVTATNFPWRLEWTGIVRTVGSSGTIMGGGFVLLGTSLTAMTLIPIDAAAQAAVTIDTTTAKQVTLGAQMGTSSASNTLTCNQFLVESVA